MIIRICLYILQKLIFRKARISHLIAFTRYNSLIKLFNLTHSNIERISHKMNLASKPYLINSEPTNNCFLHCPFCPTGKANSRTNGYADYTIYSKLLEELSRYVYLITFHGWGEPLLHNQLPELIKLAHKKSICTVVTTNGLLLNQDISQKLISSQLDVLYLSIDGVTEKSYQKYRKGGSFETAINNVTTLLQLRKNARSATPYVEWQFIVFKHNEHEISKARALARDIGVDNIVFLPAYTEYPDFEPTDPNFRLPRFSPLEKRNSCKHLWSTLSFHWNGRVVPCCYDYDGSLAYGNIENENISEIWNNSQFLKSREIIKNGYQENLDEIPCNNCVKRIELN